MNVSELSAREILEQVDLIDKKLQINLAALDSFSKQDIADAHLLREEYMLKAYKVMREYISRLHPGTRTLA